jgi:hypothetical protein
MNPLGEGLIARRRLSEVQGGPNVAFVCNRPTRGRWRGGNAVREAPLPSIFSESWGYRDVTIESGVVDFSQAMSLGHTMACTGECTLTASQRTSHLPPTNFPCQSGHF